MRLEHVAKNYDALARFYDLGDLGVSRALTRIGRLRRDGGASGAGVGTAC
jgi:hypothetical protein